MVNLDGMLLLGVLFFSFVIEGGFVWWVEVESVDFVENVWKIMNVKVWFFGIFNNFEMVVVEYVSYELLLFLIVD